MSNPNPQNTDFIFKGPRDIGYKKFFEGKNPLTEVVRFGKKVDYYSKMSNDELMKEHLTAIRDKMSLASNQKQMQRQQEKEFMDQLAAIEKSDIERKKRSRRKQFEDVMKYNQDMKSQLDEDAKSLVKEER